MMNYTVSVTSRADEDEASIYEYIEAEFGEIYAIEFREKLIHLFRLLSRQPFLGRPAKNNETWRVYILNRRNKVVYKVIDEEIIILRVLSTKTSLSSRF